MRLDPAGRASEVDPVRVAVVELVRADRPAPGALGRHEREALQVVDLVGDAPDHASAVGREVPVPDSCVDLRDDLVSAEDVRAAVLVDLRRGEDDVARGRHRVEQGVVVFGVRLLGELDVVRDHVRVVFGEVVDDSGEALARERVAPLQPGRVEVAEGLVVDRDDNDVVRLGLVTANREAQVDGVELEGAEQVRPVRDQREPGRCEADAEEEGDAKSRSRAGPLCHHSTLYEKSVPAQAAGS